MKIILTSDVDELGKVGEVVEVKAGYGRNYLIPRNMAIPATRGNMRAIDSIKAQQELQSS